MEKVEKILIISLIIVGSNLLFLDYTIFLSRKEKTAIKQPAKETIKPVLTSKLSTCPQLCLDKIKEVTQSGTITQAPEKIIERVTTNNITNNGAKESWVPIDGVGSTTAGNWIDIPGMEVYIDRTKYSDKITATFEASLKVKDNNGEVHARLFNVTKNGAADNSEIKSIGSNFNRVVSGNINLSAGNNLYRVQLFSTTQYEVSIQGAKVRIVVTD